MRSGAAVTSAAPDPTGAALQPSPTTLGSPPRTRLQARDVVVTACRELHPGDVGQEVANPAAARGRRGCGPGRPDDRGGPVGRVDLDAPPRESTREPAGPAPHVQHRPAAPRQLPQQPVVVVVVVEWHRRILDLEDAMCFDRDARPPLPPVAGAAAEQGDLVLTAADGNRLAAYFARAADPTGAGIVIMPDVRGLHAFYKELAQRFAEAGVDAVAIDYFGRTAGTGPRGHDFDYPTHVRQTTVEGVTADTGAGVAHLRSPQGGGARAVFTVGFCFGGGRSWWPATTTPRRCRSSRTSTAGSPPRACLTTCTSTRVPPTRSSTAPSSSTRTPRRTPGAGCSTSSPVTPPRGGDGSGRSLPRRAASGLLGRCAFAGVSLVVAVKRWWSAGRGGRAHGRRRAHGPLHARRDTRMLPGDQLTRRWRPRRVKRSRPRRPMMSTAAAHRGVSPVSHRSRDDGKGRWVAPAL